MVEEQSEISSNAGGKVCGEVTSVSGSCGLGFLKRMAEGEIGAFWSGVSDEDSRRKNFAFSQDSANCMLTVS